MRRHAKASTAGSTKRQAKGLGRIFRGTDATRGSSLDAKGRGAPAGRRLVLPVGAFAALLALLALVAPASATKTHLFKEVFGSAAQPSFSTPRSVAVDQSTGNVLVMEAGGGTPSIKRYNADGTPANFSGLGTNTIDGKGTGNCATVPAECDQTPQNGLSFASASESQIAVDNSGGATNGNIYVTQGSPNLINIFSAEGKYLGQLTAAGATPFTEACGVAVDASGAVYVGDYTGGIRKFVPAANPPVDADNTATFTTTTQPCAIAVGTGPTAGFIFPATFNGAISKVDSATGELKYTVSSEPNTTVTVDPGTGRVYGLGSGVKEFDASGAGSATIASSFSLPGGGRGIAVRGSNGNAYIARDGASSIQVFGPLVVLPNVTTGSASGIGPTSATFNGTVNPDGAELTECKFEYGTTAAYGQSVPCAQSPAAIGAGTSNVAVSANAGGLNLGAEYHFRLIAKNANGTVNGSDGTFKLQSPPALNGEWSTSVVFTEATLHAQINPEGFASTYKFEWGPTAAYGSATPDGSAGSDKADHKVILLLDGLQPGTTYHYRVITTNTIGTTTGADHTFTTYANVSQDTNCANQAFRIGPAADLPDCRAYEMVSPVDKNGGDITPSPSSFSKVAAYFEQAAVSGDKVTYSSGTAFGDAVGATQANQYLSTRAASGWQTHGISPRKGAKTTFLYSSRYDLDSPFRGFSEDLSSAWVANNNKEPLLGNAISGVPNLYRRDNLTDEYETLTVNPATQGDLEELEFRGASADGRYQMFDVEAALTPDAAPTSNRQLYVFFEGQLHLVSVLPDGSPAAGSAAAGSMPFGGAEDARRANVQGAVSEDGQRIFWSSSGGSSTPHVYVRENPTQPQSALDGGGSCTEPSKACTTDISASVSSGQAVFWGADPSGSRVLFTDSDGGEYGPGDLYEYDVDSATPTLIATGAEGVMGFSKELDYIYLVSQDALASGAVNGENNIYVWHNGQLTYIHTLTASDLNASGDASSPVAAIPLSRSSRVTPDGLHLVFVSNSTQLAALTAGYDNLDALTEKPLREIYRYEFDGETTCVSCNPSGVRPSSGMEPYMHGGVHSLGNTGVPVAAWIPTWGHETHAERVLSDDGTRVFFNSFDPLLPQDNNGVLDVYQWETEGAGTCDQPGGCLSLISTGESTANSEFVDASASGNDVFFRTSSRLDPRDPGSVDLYDARADGGFPLPPRSPECLGDACQSPPDPPNDQTPASASFRGASDPKPVRARNCATRTERAAALNRRAQGLRRKAEHASSQRQAALLRKRSIRLADEAQGLIAKARRCRRAERRAAR